MKRLFIVFTGVLFLASTGLTFAATESQLHKAKHHLKKTIAKDKIKKDEDQAAAKQAVEDGNDKGAIKDEQAAIKEKKDIHKDDKKLKKVDKKIKKDKNGIAGGDDWQNGIASGTAGSPAQGQSPAQDPSSPKNNGGSGAPQGGTMGQTSQGLANQVKN